MALKYNINSMSLEDMRIKAENDLAFFIYLVTKGNRVLGNCHLEVIKWWNRLDKKPNDLLLFPRDHQKSALIAFRVAQKICKDPTVRILYLSNTTTLAEKQLDFIKTILTSDAVKTLWSDLINTDEGKRTKWTAGEISVDHPARKEAMVRDSTVFTAGLSTSITGLHVDITVLDDVVVKENSEDAAGRNKVQAQYSLLSSIESPGAEQWVVGTRYHPNDLYSSLKEMSEEVYNEETGEITGYNKVFDVMEKVVEDRGDGTGQFLWTRSQGLDGKWYGFDKKVLAAKRAKYLDKRQYRAQYYNNPTDPDAETLQTDDFQYYDKKDLTNTNGIWYHKGYRLVLSCAIDFAYSLTKRSDYTAIVLVGQDSERNFYVLDIDRFKTEKISEYYDRIIKLYRKWHFRDLLAETTAAQQVIVTNLIDNFIRPNKIPIRVKQFKPTRQQGSKEERMSAILDPLYDNKQIFHYYGGLTQVLEEELITKYPAHDDLKDSLANAIENCNTPSRAANRLVTDVYDEDLNLVGTRNQGIKFHNRFGGIC